MRVLKACLKAAVTSLWLLGLAGGSETYDCDAGTTYSVDSMQAYQLDRLMPQGCSCENGQMSDSECTDFDCSCICDLTAGQCDFNCCCDPECTADQKSRFDDDLESCLAEGPSTGVINKCYTNTALNKVNPRFPMTTESTAESSVNEMLCVYYDNSDIKGTYYSDPGFQTSDIFTESSGEKEYNYENYLNDGESSTIHETQYDRGVMIPAAFQSGDGTVAAYGGFLPIPTPGPDGTCVESSYARFMEPVRSNTCLRISSDLEKDCTDLFDFGRFSNLLLVASDPSVSPATTGGISDWVNVTVSSITYLRADGSEILVGNGTVMGNAASYSGGTCNNALTSVCYTVTFAADGTIDGVAADITLTNLTSTGSSVVLEQSYTIEYSSPAFASMISATSYGNVVNRTRSGNPGYLHGLPLLAARPLRLDSATETVMSARIPGLQLRGTKNDGSCSTGDDTAVTVNFGEDIFTGCTLALNLSSFQEMCNLGGKHVERSTLLSEKEDSDVYVPTYLNITDTYVGIFGNADPLDHTQWLKIALETTSTIPSYKTATQTCDDMITSLHYKFLVAYVGSETNPQAKIIGAQVEYKREDVTFFAEDSQQQNFMFFTTVSFITYGDSNYNVYAPPAPPVLFSVPYDMFYPFAINAGPATFSHTSALYGAVTTATLSLLLVVTPLVVQSEW